MFHKRRGARKTAATFVIASWAVAVATLGFASAADRSEIVINDTREFPESLTSTANGTVLFGSLSKGNVYRAVPGSGTAEVWIRPGTAGLKNVLGVFADDRDKVLWVCSSILDQAGSGGATHGDTSLKAFDLSTGALKVSYAFPGGKGICNDIALAKDGTLYATETSEGQILRLKRGASSLERWSSDPLLASADGIAVLSDGSLYVNGFRTGSLVRVPVRADGSAGQAVKLATSRPLVHPDGMRSVGSKTMLLAEGEGRLDEVTIDGEKAEIRVLKGDFMDGPTAVTLIGDRAFVLEAKLNYLNDPTLKGQDPGPFRALALPYHAPK